MDDDDIRSPFKKRYEYKEHISYRSFQLNDVLTIQIIFAFVCRSRQRGVRKTKKSRIRNPEPEQESGTDSSNRGILGNTESSSAVKSFLIYNTR